jgi:RNA polymerase sigma-70 factor (ECF subfamily)
MTLRDAAALDAAVRAEHDADADVPLQMDEASFRDFYGRTARALWLYLARLTGDRQAAEDLLQEAYYRFLRSGARLDGDVHRRRYLFRIATNLARDSWRRQSARPATVAEPAETVAAHVPASLDLSAGRYDRRLDLSRALGHLRPRDRAMLWLAYALGASHREIAEVVNVDPSSVKTLLMRARRRLAARLRPARGGGS